MTVLTKRQEQILTIMEEGREYTTEAIAGIIGLKGPRTRQLMNELVELGKVESIGTTRVNHFFYVIPIPLTRRHRTLTVA